MNPLSEDALGIAVQRDQLGLSILSLTAFVSNEI
jgi:hypothetical protein